MQIYIHPDYKDNSDKIENFIINFDTKGLLFGDGQRNTIKLFDLNGTQVNIKSFKVPNFINKIAYQFFRKSKAKRSYKYANKLIESKIGTPKPIAYGENFSTFGLEKSYYISEHLQTELTFRELVEQPDYPENEIILKQFTQFSFDLHQKGIEFLDHSPGNTLIKKVGNEQYSFFLVDLNRMNFHHQMNFDQRMKNLSRLTPKKEMIAVMSDEYAKLYEKPYSLVLEKMWHYTQKFQEKYHRKQKLKEQLFFWKTRD